MILSDVRAILTSGGIGWRVFENQAPAGTSTVPAPNEMIVLYEYPGAPPLHVKGMASPAQRTPRLQVVCFSKILPGSNSFGIARAKAEEVFGLLAGYSGVVNGTRYASIRALGEPSPLPNDGDRVRVSTNFEAVVM